eukprot:NODE_119_length_18186_cov_1.929397.p14 type:complete len:128 gc:universal NODE_119_length_18186_cov_1.929397:16476-16093(-)
MFLLLLTITLAFLSKRSLEQHNQDKMTHFKVQKSFEKYLAYNFDVNPGDALHSFIKDDTLNNDIFILMTHLVSLNTHDLRAIMEIWNLFYSKHSQTQIISRFSKSRVENQYNSFTHDGELTKIFNND